jgi:hypothetical protein
VEEGVRGVISLARWLQDLWLQDAALIVAIITGIAGTVLGGLNLWLRIRESRPRLLVATDLEPTREDGETKYRLVIVVRNRSHVPVLVDRLYFESPHPTQGMIEIQVPETYGQRKIPFWLEPSDREGFQVMTEFMFHRMERKGFEGRFRATGTVVDGGGNRYRSNPFDVDLSDPPQVLHDAAQV